MRDCNFPGPRRSRGYGIVCNPEFQTFFHKSGNFLYTLLAKLPVNSTGFSCDQVFTVILHMKYVVISCICFYYDLECPKRNFLQIVMALPMMRGRTFRQNTSNCSIVKHTDITCFTYKLQSQLMSHRWRHICISAENSTDPGFDPHSNKQTNQKPHMLHPGLPSSSWLGANFRGFFQCKVNM